MLKLKCFKYTYLAECAFYLGRLNIEQLKCVERNLIKSMRKLGVLVDGNTMSVSVSDIMNWTAQSVSIGTYGTEAELVTMLTELVSTYNVDTIVMGKSTGNVKLSDYQKSLGDKLRASIKANIVLKQTDVNELKADEVSEVGSIQAVVSTLFLQKFLDENSTTTVTFNSVTE